MSSITDSTLGTDAARCVVCELEQDLMTAFQMAYQEWNYGRTSFWRLRHPAGRAAADFARERCFNLKSDLERLRRHGHT